MSYKQVQDQVQAERRTKVWCRQKARIEINVIAVKFLHGDTFNGHLRVDPQGGITGVCGNAMPQMEIVL